MRQRPRWMEVHQEYDLKPPPVGMVLKHLEEPTPMGRIGDFLCVDGSTVTWIVDRLEKRGLVERHAHERDRRVKAVTLSSRGEELRAQLLDDLYRPPSAMAQLSRRDLQALRRLAVRLRDQASK